MFAFAAVAAAAPGYTSGYTLPLTTYRKEIIPGNTYTEVHPRVAVVEQPYVTKIGDHVSHVPTAVSHQSSTVVHSKADIVTPILAHGVAKSVVPAEPIVRTYQTPSIVKTYAEPAAIAYQHAAPLAYSHSYALPSAYYGNHYAGHYGAHYGGLAYNKYW